MSAGLPFHPLANLFPLIEGAEFDAIVADMRANGFRVGDEIVLLDGMILDGRNRYRAALAAGIFPADVEPKTRWEFVEFSRDGIDGLFDEAQIERGPLDFVIAKNLRRRHLDESQRALVAARIATMRQGERTDVQPSANLRKVSQAEAAKLLNVSPRTVASAKAVEEHGVPELLHAVERGRIAVSAAAQAAKLAPDLQRQVAQEAETGRAGAVRTMIKKEARSTREQTLAARQRALPQKKYGVILADPEWRFEPWSRESGMDRAADNHYPTSPLAAIKARGVGAIAAEDCALFLWATAPMLPQALEVLAAWGFAYRSHVIWLKERPGDGRGTGYWFTSEHELLLVGTRGQVPAPAPGTQAASVLAFPVRGHSQKPDWQYELIESYFPTLPKIELNARRRREGWDAWGLEAPEETAAEESDGLEEGRATADQGEARPEQSESSVPGFGNADIRGLRASRQAGDQREEIGSGAEGASALVNESVNATAPQPLPVTPGLDPGVHAAARPASDSDVDGRVKPGHDEGGDGDDLDIPAFLRREPAQGAAA